jgi:hypothetical protein
MNQVRLPAIQGVKLFSTVFVSVLQLIIYNKLDGTKEGIQNRNGFLFFLNVNLGFSGLSNVSMVFPSERPVFMREVNNGMYRVSSYFWSKIVTELPISLFLPMVTNLIVFWWTGLNNMYWYSFLE